MRLLSAGVCFYLSGLLVPGILRAQTARPGQQAFLAVSSWTGAFTITAKATGQTQEGPIRESWSVDNTASGTVRLEKFDPVLNGWEGTLIGGTASINERTVVTLGDCTQTVTSRASGSLLSDSFGGPRRVFLALGLNSDTYSFYFSDRTIRGEQVHLQQCPGTSFETRMPVPLIWDPTHPRMELPLPSGVLTLAGTVSLNTGARAFSMVPTTTPAFSYEVSWTFTPGAVQPPPTDPDETVDDPCRVSGSVIGCQNQSLGEIVAIAGTPFQLHYQSDRVPGRAGANASWRGRAPGLGGWSLSAHHAFDPAGKVLYLGEGSRRSGEALTGVKALGADIAGLSATDFLIPTEDGSEVYVFSQAGRHLRTLDALTGLVRFRFDYDSAGRLTRITDGEDNATLVERDGSGNPVAVVGPYGQRTALSLDPAGYLASIANPAGETVRFSYGQGGLLTSLTDARGGISRFSYDAEGRLTRAENAAGAARTLTRSRQQGASTVTLTSPMGRTASWLQEKPASGGERRGATGSAGVRNESTTAADGALTLRYPDGAVLTYGWAPDPRWGMLSPLPARLSVITTAGITSAAAMTREVTLADSRNPLSLTALTDTAVVNGQRYVSSYSGSSRTSTHTSPAGRQSSVTFDSRGRVVREQPAGFLPNSFSYDNRGRLERIAMGTEAEERTLTFRYDDNGQVESLTDALGRTMRFAWDRAGRMSRQVFPDGAAVEFAYDAGGNLTAVTPPGRPTHRFAYNPLNYLTRYAPPEAAAGGEISYSYDPDGAMTRAGLADDQASDFVYDAAGRLQAVKLPHGSNSYGYDADTGHLISATAPGDIAVSWSYGGGLLRSERWDGPVSGAVSRVYDGNFRLASLSVDDEPVVREYDSDGLLVRVGELTLERQAANGLVTATALGTVNESWTYNGFGEPASHVVRAGETVLYKAEYSRNKLGHIVEKVETAGAAEDVYRYSYDSRSRLVEVAKNGAVVASYTYDANDNRLSYDGEGGPVTAAYDDQDRLLRYGESEYEYSRGGTVRRKSAGDAAASYEFDLAGNLRGAALPDGRRIEYVIDGAGRRIGRKLDGRLVQGFLYVDDLRIAAELDGSSGLVSRFVYAGNSHVPVYMVKGGGAFRIVTDLAGSPRLVVEAASGEVMQRMDYDAFGNVTRDTNPGFQPFGFAGGLYDRDTKLLRFGAREYDAETGRWMSKDPVGMSRGDTNLYVYAWNNPVNVSDREGLEPAPLPAGTKLVFVKTSWGHQPAVKYPGVPQPQPAGLRDVRVAQKAVNQPSLNPSKSVTVLKVVSNPLVSRLLQQFKNRMTSRPAHDPFSHIRPQDAVCSVENYQREQEIQKLERERQLREKAMEELGLDPRKQLDSYESLVLEERLAWHRSTGRSPGVRRSW